MSTKTASVRLDTEQFDRIDEHCVGIGCSRNDFIKSAIDAALKDDDVDDHKSHQDSYGNRWYWDKNEEIWVCQIN